MGPRLSIELLEDAGTIPKQAGVPAAAAAPSRLQPLPQGLGFRVCLGFLGLSTEELTAPYQAVHSCFNPWNLQVSSL